MGFVSIYIKLGILSLCTEPWHGTRSISISWDFCLYWKAIWWINYVQSNLVERSPRLSGHFVTLPAIFLLFSNFIKRSPPICGQRPAKMPPDCCFWPHERPVFPYLLSNQWCQMTLCRLFLLDYCVCAVWQSINNVMSIMIVNNCQLRLGEQGRSKGIKGS